MSALPAATSESEITIGGYRLRVYQLDDGRRIINADDFTAIIGAFERGLILSQDEADKLAAHVRGPKAAAA